MGLVGAFAGAIYSIQSTTIANAVFDATGVRIRRYPLVAERVKKALA